MDPRPPETSGPDPAAEVPVRLWGSLVGSARRSRQLTQAALAGQVGVVQQTISKIEAGVLCPPDDLKVRLARAVDVPVAELFPWPPDHAPEDRAPA